MQLFTGFASRWRAIIVANLIFTISHFHISVLFGILSFLPGLLWGWLFAKYETLAGTILCHLIVGIWCIYCLNIGAILGISL